METKHKPYYYAFEQRKDYYLKWTKGFGGLYYLEDGYTPFDCMPRHFYFGERWLYLTPGLDTHFDGGYRGNKSDDWPCIDFGMDVKRGIEWLHGAEESSQLTPYLWTKNPDYNE